MKSNNNVILLSGRPGSGKTVMLIAYANMYPKTTLILSEESTKETLVSLNLLKDVDVVNESNFNNIDISKYDTICIDYLELFNKIFINEKIKLITELNLRLIILTQLDRNYNIRLNPFKEIFEGDS
jgi:predicted ATP-dependent serine protease